MAKVSVVILNYNGKHFLEKFLDKVIRYSPGAEVIVADNHSTDDSLTYLQSNFPALRVITMDQNHGFSGGYNKALEQVSAEYFVILNSDVEVTQEWIEPVIEYMDKNQDVAACQPKILSYHDTSSFEYAGAAGGYIDILGYPFCRGRIFHTLEKDKGQYNDTVDIFWATGACLFIRSEVFRKVGGFDDYYFAHMEEIDLCWRINIAGHRISFVPQSKIFHVGGGTLPKESPRKTYLNFRNSLVTLYKNSTAASLFWKLPARMALDVIAAIKFIITDGADSFLAVVKANFHFYSNLGKFNKKRKEAVYRSGRKIKLPCGNLLVFDYYLKGKKKFSDLNIDR